jgi:hypothetical protein
MYTTHLPTILGEGQTRLEDLPRVFRLLWACRCCWCLIILYTVCNNNIKHSCKTVHASSVHAVCIQSRLSYHTCVGRPDAPWATISIETDGRGRRSMWSGCAVRCVLAVLQRPSHAIWMCSTLRFSRAAKTITCKLDACGFVDGGAVARACWQCGRLATGPGRLRDGLTGLGLITTTARHHIHPLWDLGDLTLYLNIHALTLR